MYFPWLHATSCWHFVDPEFFAYVSAGQVEQPTDLFWEPLTFPYEPMEQLLQPSDKDTAPNWAPYFPGGQ